jgi:multiple sugar transport system ATP-binding protein
MIYVTHDPVEAMTLGDRVAVMNGGVVEQVDRPLTVYRQPGSRFVAGFLGWPPMSFLDGEVVARAAGAVFVEARVARRLAGQGAGAGPAGEAAFVGAGGKIPLPTAGAGWSGYAGRPLTLGIRPEDVIIRADGKAGPALAGTVALAEPLGRFVLVTCMAAGWRLAGMLGAGEPTPAEGQNVMMSLDLSQAYLFDRRSGRTLLAGSGTG